MKTSGTIGMVLHHKGETVWTICPEATVYEAISILASKNIGALPVLDGGELIGMFSERDYTRKVALEGKSSRTMTVRELISKPVFSVSPHQTIEDGMRLMSEKRIRHLPVIEDDKIIGMISIGDLVNWIISAQTSTIEQMEAYITGGR